MSLFFLVPPFRWRARPSWNLANCMMDSTTPHFSILLRKSADRSTACRNVPGLVVRFSFVWLSKVGLATGET